MVNQRYTFHASWSPDDGEYLAVVEEFPSVSWLAPTAAEAVAGAERLIADILTDMLKAGESAPPPHSEFG